MAKIIKVASSTSTPRIANQFKTSRSSTTNPFKYQSFEGNTLDVSAFADVFESSAIKQTSKMKLIAASVAGSIHKIKSSITEPIINFVNKICGSISSAWDYAKNTNISDLGVVKGINSSLKGFGEYMSKPIDIPGSKAMDSAISGVKRYIGTINSALSTNVLDLGKDISTKWASIIAKTHSGNKISSDMSVAELENLWKSEISSASFEEVA